MNSVDAKVTLTINNMPEGKAEGYPYLIITPEVATGEFWYYGAYDNLNQVREICEKINKIYVPNPFYKG